MKLAQLAKLAVEAEACRNCALGFSRTQAVFGVGDPNAQVMFVGEAPGANEDLIGEPFVGRAGKLLDELIQVILGLTREQVYIANVVKCRPVGNRDPLPTEVAACRPFLDQQLQIVKPRVVVTLGNFATKLLAATNIGIMRLRGKPIDFGELVLVPVLHPAAALRGTNAMKAIRQDFKQVKLAIDAGVGSIKAPSTATVRNALHDSVSVASRDDQS